LVSNWYLKGQTWKIRSRANQDIMQTQLPFPFSFHS
jgi:hypothetical protein